jgi:hypothetical protein
MKPKLFIRKAIAIILPLALFSGAARGQETDCVLLPPAVTIDFGSGNITDMNTTLPKYQHDFTTCPPDGFYSYASRTSGCFNDDWLTFNRDHTSNGNGNMMLVNASETGGVFFNTGVVGLKPNTRYQFGVYLVNVCKRNGGCSPLPANITVRLLTTEGKIISEFITGQLPQNDVVQWKKYFGYFITPPQVSALIINMEDTTPGGCGNDFAMDDITFSECVQPKPVVQPVAIQPEKPLLKQSRNDSRTERKKTAVKPATGKKAFPVTTHDEPAATIPVTKLPATNGNALPVSIPQPLLTRENPVIKEIKTAAGEMVIDLYDNGEIDGDTVTVYDNNQLLVSRAGLSDKPVHFSIKVDGMMPHHELVMVANNLGSIPPNTSLMIITAGSKRYEVHISSSEQKNAKVVIDLRE